VLHCPNCNFAYNSFSADSTVFDEYYKQNTNDFYSTCGFDQRYRHQRDLILTLTGDPPKKILDFGAGTGRLIAEFERMGIQCTGTDVETNQNIFGKSKYDLIIISHVLEHLIDPVGQIRFLSELLSENGMIYIEVPDPTGYYNHHSLEFLRYIDRLHINHFSFETMAKISRLCMLSFTNWGRFDFEYLDETSYPAAYFVLRKTIGQMPSLSGHDESLAVILGKYLETEKKRVADRINDVQEGDIAYGIGDNFFRFLGVAGIENRLRQLIWCDGKYSGKIHVGDFNFHILNIIDIKPTGRKAYIFVTGPGRKSVGDSLLQMGFREVEFC
jgi:SAM-dependent methyltransferase